MISNLIIPAQKMGSHCLYHWTLVPEELATILFLFLFLFFDIFILCDISTDDALQELLSVTVDDCNVELTNLFPRKSIPNFELEVVMI